MSDELKVLYPAPGKVAPVAAEPTADADVEPTLIIAPDHIQIGDVVLPGRYIDRRGIVIHPGSATLATDGSSSREGARVSVTFLVGDIHVDEFAAEDVMLHQRLDFALGLERDLTPIDGANADTGVLDASLDDDLDSADADVLAVLDPGRAAGS